LKQHLETFATGSMLGQLLDRLVGKDSILTLMIACFLVHTATTGSHATPELSLFSLSFTHFSFVLCVKCMHFLYDGTPQLCD
jgi:hypothetical protein